MNSEFTIQKWGRRFWAVFDGDGLICIAAYKKGALEVKRRLEEMEQRRSQEAPSLPTAASPAPDPVPPCSLLPESTQSPLPTDFPSVG
jgi:hypothetical protein